MKSREGTVVDADDLLDEMVQTARVTTETLGKANDFTEEEQVKLFETIGLAALKYYMLKVDPKKNMLFNPEESIDFNGNTGPFVLYTYARIQSIFRKAGLKPESLINYVKTEGILFTKPEKEIIKQLYQYPEVLTAAGENFNPSAIANYCYELVKTYNHYYQDTPIYKGVEMHTSNFRMALSWYVGKIIRHSVGLLGISVTDRM
jgi:arginyl-tRNA synthetase